MKRLRKSLKIKRTSVKKEIFASNEVQLSLRRALRRILQGKMKILALSPLAGLCYCSDYLVVSVFSFCFLVSFQTDNISNKFYK